MKFKSVLTCVFLLIAGLVEGATIEYKPSEPFPYLALSGEIKTGDAKKLLALLLDPRLFSGGSLTVNSPGGSVDEAIKIAKLVKSLYMSVHVESTGYCASACFFIFLAGSGKLASGAELMDPADRRELDAHFRKKGFPLAPGFVGLHRPFLTRIDSLNNKQSDAMRSVRSYLEGELLPGRLIDLMMSKPSNDIYWLREDDLAEIGEYPPEQEEYLIQKCSYDRNLAVRLTAAKTRGDRAATKKLVDQMFKEMKCTVNATSAASEATMLKLKSGWLPY